MFMSSIRSFWKKITQKNVLLYGIPSSIGISAAFLLWKKKQEENKGPDWEAYYQATLNNKVDQSYIDLIKQIQSTKTKEKKVLDIGTGTGRYALYTAKQDYEVFATDRQPHAIEITEKRLKEAGIKNFKTLHHDIAENELTPEMKKNKYLLITLARVLPFIRKEKTEAVIKKLAQLLHKPDGYMYGHFFGKQHSWCDDPEIHCVSKEEVYALLKKAGFSEIKIDEFIQKDHPSAVSGPTNWHEFTFTAKN